MASLRIYPDSDFLKAGWLLPSGKLTCSLPLGLGYISADPPIVPHKDPSLTSKNTSSNSLENLPIWN